MICKHYLLSLSTFFPLAPCVSHDPEGAEGGELDTDSLHSKLKQVKDLRAEIDRLRSLVSNKYAEDMGNECITQ